MLNDVIFHIVAPFLGGIGMFLFGMKIMSDNLEKIAGSRLRNMLDVITKNRFAGMAVGAIFTMIIQSSSATTVMVVGFVNAGLMNLLQAASVIMGANIGTTITAQLIAINLKEIAPLILFVGVVLVFFTRRSKPKTLGSVLVGFGLLFIGMATMSSAMSPLREMEGFTSIIGRFENPILGVLAGATLTGVIQSSSASMGILQAMALEGLIDLKGAIFIILGFNIGTCITAMLAVIGANKTAKRAAVIHLLFNIIGSLVFILLVEVLPIVEWIQSISGEPIQQLANFHTIFNISMTILLLPFAGYMVFLSKKIITGEDPVKEPMKLKYIEEHMFAAPAVVTAQISLEVDRMAKLARKNIDDSLNAFMNKDPKLIESVLDREQVIDFLNHEISEYLVKATQMELSDSDREYISKLFHIVSDIERIGDHAENVAEFAQSRIDRKMKYSDKAMEELTTFKALVLEIIDKAVIVFKGESDVVTAESVLELENEIDTLEKKLRKRHIKRLKKQECNARAGTIFIDLLSNLERVADHANNIANATDQDD